MAGKIWYPIFLDIEGELAVVVGGGKVALRKTRGLVEAGARVRVVAPEFLSGFHALGTVDKIVRPFEDGDIEGAALVFAATNSREVNRRVGNVARVRGIPCNIADSPEECRFIVPARVNGNGLQIAISTGGENPRRAAAVRKKLEDWLVRMRP